jgi:hypothetical protein
MIGGRTAVIGESRLYRLGRCLIVVPLDPM